MTALFVTSSGTEIGKTYVTSLLILQRRAQEKAVQAIKPVVSGISPESFATSDPGQILAALGEETVFDSIGKVSRWHFEAALSPDMAARAEGRAIDYDELVGHCVEAADAGKPLIIEGVGGVMVPLDDQHLVLDWMRDIKTKTPLRTVLVVGSYLGTISHTLTALSVLRHDGLEPTAVVVSESDGSTVPFDETCLSLQRFVGEVPLIPLPRFAWGEEAPDLTWLLDD